MISISLNSHAIRHMKRLCTLLPIVSIIICNSNFVDYSILVFRSFFACFFFNVLSTLYGLIFHVFNNTVDIFNVLCL